MVRSHAVPVRRDCVRGALVASAKGRLPFVPSACRGCHGKRALPLAKAETTDARQGRCKRQMDPLLVHALTPVRWGGTVDRQRKRGTGQ